MSEYERVNIDVEALKRYARPQDDLAYRALVHIRDKYDQQAVPEIGLFLSIFDTDVGGIKKALNQGADPNKRLGQVFRQHASALEDFRAFGAELEAAITRTTETIRQLSESVTPTGLTK